MELINHNQWTQPETDMSITVTFEKTIQKINNLQQLYGGHIVINSNQSIVWSVPVNEFVNMAKHNKQYAFPFFIKLIHPIFNNALYNKSVDAKNDNYILTIKPIIPFTDFKYKMESLDRYPQENVVKFPKNKKDPI